MGPICHTDWAGAAADGAAEKRGNHSTGAQIPAGLLRREVRSRVFVFHPKRAINKQRKIPPKSLL